MVDMTLTAEECNAIDEAAKASKCDCWLYVDDAHGPAHILDLEDGSKPMETGDAVVMLYESFGEDPAKHLDALTATMLEGLYDRGMRANALTHLIEQGKPYRMDVDVRKGPNGDWATVHIEGCGDSGWFRYECAVPRVRPFKAACRTYTHIVEATIPTVSKIGGDVQWALRRIWEPVSSGNGVAAFR